MLTYARLKRVSLPTLPMSSTMSLWNELLNTYSPTQINFFGTAFVQLICFWGTSIIYTALPFIFPTFSLRHKLQPNDKQPTPADLWVCFKVVGRNQLVTSLFHFTFLNLRAYLARPSAYRLDPTLPGLNEIVRHIIFGMLVREVLFYYVHRLLHHPSIYPSVHKPHHKFIAPVALAAQYATITEHIFANILPISIPLTLIHAHIVTFWIFAGLVLVETTTVHSGFDFFRGLAKMHDLHHEKFLINFGTVGLLDKWHRTDGKAAKME